MSLSAQLLADVHVFVRDLGISETALGQKSVGNPSVFARLRAGKSIRLDTTDKIYTYMAHERLRRAEAGARRATACQEGACLSEAEAQDRAAALEGGPGWSARLLAWFKGGLS